MKRETSSQEAAMTTTTQTTMTRGDVWQGEGRTVEVVAVMGEWIKWVDTNTQDTRCSFSPLAEFRARFTPRLTPEVLGAMRAWAADCEWLDTDSLDEATDAQIVRGIRRHYAGGLEQFLADGQGA